MRWTTEQELGYEIARVRHGQDVTASDLANRLMPWLDSHDAERTKRVRASQSEKDQKVTDDYMQKLAHRVMDVFQNADEADTADDVMPMVFAAIGLSEAFGVQEASDG